jgi:apolipoprotein N-acyltransferase
LRRLARDLLLTTLSGAVYALAFPPARMRVLAWVSLVPFLLALRDAPLRRRLVLAAWLSLVVGWGTGMWMPGAVAEYFDQPLVVGFALFLLVTLAMAAPYYMAFAAVYAPLVRRFGGAAAPLLVGAAWASADLLRGRLLNGTPIYVGNSPWATFGYSQIGVDPLVQIASVTGVYGISFMLTCANAAFAEAASEFAQRRRVGRRTSWGLAAAALVVGGVAGFGALELRGAPSVSEGHRTPVALAQANLGAAARWEDGGATRTLDAYLRLTREAFERGDPEIVFWPESALTLFLEREPLYQRSLGLSLLPAGAELVAGAPRAEGADGSAPYRNSVYLVSPEGVLRARYDKVYLLPFMEYFPLRLDFVRRRFGRVREFSPGLPTPPLPTRAGLAGVLVCNEALLPQVAAERVTEGASYLINPSNDSWVADTGFAEQQFDIVALRAVEQRVWLVRVSDSGPSAVIDPFGRVLARTQPRTRDLLLSAIGESPGHSIYGRVGDLFGVLCLGAVALALGVARGWGKASGSREATR